MSNTAIDRGFDLGDNEQGQEHARHLQDIRNQTHNTPDQVAELDKILAGLGLSSVLVSWHGKVPPDIPPQVIKISDDSIAEAKAKLEALITAARKQGELSGRSDELVRLAEWGEAIDNQWNDHFSARLAQLKKENGE